MPEAAQIQEKEEKNPVIQKLKMIQEIDQDLMRLYSQNEIKYIGNLLRRRRQLANSLHFAKVYENSGQSGRECKDKLKDNELALLSVIDNPSTLPADCQ